MILIGLSWLLFWTLVKVFSIDILIATLVTAITFIVAGLVLEQRSIK